MNLTLNLFKNSSIVNAYEANELNMFCLDMTNKAKNVYVSRLSTPYHNQQHIVEMSSFFFKYLTDTNRDYVEYLDVYFAILFHDIIYIPGCKSNEKYSAQYVIENIKAAIDHSPAIYTASIRKVINETFLDSVSFLIKRTTINDHLKEFNNEKLNLLLDLDLISLAANRAKFISNQGKILYENTLDPLYLKGSHPRQVIGLRKCHAFLIRLLDKGYIYRTEYFKNRYEELAVTNLKFLETL